MLSAVLFCFVWVFDADFLARLGVKYAYRACTVPYLRCTRALEFGIYYKNNTHSSCKVLKKIVEMFSKSLFLKFKLS